MAASIVAHLVTGVLANEPCEMCLILTVDRAKHIVQSYTYRVYLDLFIGKLFHSVWSSSILRVL